MSLLSVMVVKSSTEPEIWMPKSMMMAAPGFMMRGGAGSLRTACPLWGLRRFSELAIPFSEVQTMRAGGMMKEDSGLSSVFSGRTGGSACKLVARSKAQARMGWWIDLFMVCGRVA